MLAMPSAFLVKESSAEIFARAAIMLLHSITRPVREPASRSDDTKRRQDMTLDWSTYRTAPTGKFSTGASPCFGCRRPWAGPAVAAASLAPAPLIPGQALTTSVPYRSGFRAWPRRMKVRAISKHSHASRRYCSAFSRDTTNSPQDRCHAPVKPRLDRAIECRLAEVGQPSGSLVIVREPSALTLIVPAPARFSCS